MAHAENQLVIARPAAEVYAFLADGLNNPKWRPGVLDISLASGQAGTLGAVYRQVMSGPGGRKIDGDYRITKAEPGRRLDFEVVAGPAHPNGSYVLEEVPEGTKVTFALDLPTKGLMKLMDGMIAKTMQAEVANLAGLKSVLEG